MLAKVFVTFAHRFREPSSWSGIAVLLAMFGLTGDQAGAVTDLLAATAAAAAIFVNEPGAPAS